MTQTSHILLAAVAITASAVEAFSPSAALPTGLGRAAASKRSESPPSICTISTDPCDPHFRSSQNAHFFLAPCSRRSVSRVWSTTRFAHPPLFTGPPLWLDSCDASSVDVPSSISVRKLRLATLGSSSLSLPLSNSLKQCRNPTSPQCLGEATPSPSTEPVSPLRSTVQMGLLSTCDIPVYAPKVLGSRRLARLINSNCVVAEQSRLSEELEESISAGEKALASGDKTGEHAACSEALP